MSEMSVKMVLTLSDGATAPLQAFIDKLAGMESAVGTLNSKLTGLGTQLSNIGTKAEASSGGMSALEKSVLALADGLAAISSKLSSSAASFVELGGAASMAGNQMLGAAGKMAEAGAAVDNTTAKVDGLSTSLKGMAGLWAAFEVKKGLAASIEESANYQSTQTRLKNLNLGGDGANQLMNAADATAKSTPQFSREQTLSMGIDLVNATGSVDHAVQMMTPFAQAVYNMKAALPTGQTFTDRDMLLLAKALEQRGVTTDPAKMQAELDMFSKITAATQGRVGPSQLLGNINYAKGGLGLTMEDSFMPVFASLIERTMAGGGTGGQVGTALTSLQQAIVGGVIKQSALIQWDKMGLLDPSKVIFNKVGSLKGVQAGGVAGADLFMRNPNEWVQQYLVPALKNSGVDTSNTEQVNGVLAHMFGNRNAANIASIMATQQNLVNKDAAIINNTLDNTAQRANNIKTAKAAWDEFHASLANLANSIGTSILPAITNLVNGIANLIGNISDFAKDHQFLTAIATWTAAIAGVVLAITSLAKLFGITLAENIAAASGALLAGGRTSIIAGAMYVESLGGIGAAAVALAGKVLLATRALSGLFMLTYSSDLNAGEDAKFQQMKSNHYKNQPIESDFGVTDGWGSDTPKAKFFKPSGSTGGGSPHTKIPKPKKPISDSLNDIARFNAQADEELKHFASLAKDIEGIDRDYMKLTGGDDTAAVISDTQKQGDAKSADLRANGYASAAQKNDDLTKLKIAHLQYAEAMAKVKVIEDALTESEKKLGYAIKAGTITATEAANKQIEIRREAAAQMIPLLDSASKYATNETDKSFSEGKISAAQSDMLALNATALEVKNNMQSAFGGFFNGLLTNTKTLKQSFADLFKSIADNFAQMISKMMAQKLTDAIFNAGSNGGGQGGGWMSQVLGSIFGGGGTASTYGTIAGSEQTAMLAAQDAGTSSALSGIGSWFSSLLSFDVGTDYVPNDMVAMIHKGEKIVPAAYNNPKSQGAGNVVQHLNFNFDQPQSSQTMMQLASATGMSMQRAMQRNL
jgi:hypothetical protein